METMATMAEVMDIKTLAVVDMPDIQVDMELVEQYGLYYLSY